ncbi:MAG: hypothetical protein O3A00_23270 [Planctomycetota bacterium]|nr:hypothetical protein [Planctomycetota bacterium]
MPLVDLPLPNVVAGGEFNTGGRDSAHVEIAASEDFIVRPFSRAFADAFLFNHAHQAELVNGIAADRDAAFCQQYNIVFLRACESFGLVGRLVSIGPGNMTDRIRGGHESVEVWSNEFLKWIYIDGNTAWYAVDVESHCRDKV